MHTRILPKSKLALSRIWVNAMWDTRTTAPTFTATGAYRWVISHKAYNLLLNKRNPSKWRLQVLFFCCSRTLLIMQPYWHPRGSAVGQVSYGTMRVTYNASHIIKRKVSHDIYARRRWFTLSGVKFAWTVLLFCFPWTEHCACKQLAHTKEQVVVDIFLPQALPYSCCLAPVISCSLNSEENELKEKLSKTIPMKEDNAGDMLQQYGYSACFYYRCRMNFHSFY